MPKVKVNDININYEIHGEGFPLLMIMGVSASLEIWDRPLINELSKRFKVILFDNRGAGKTDKPYEAYSIKLMADDTAGLMDALKIECAHVLGMSMGGMIAQELVLNYPNKVDKLVLWGTNCGGTKSEPPSLRAFKLLIGAVEGLTAEKVAKGTMSLIFTQEFIKNNPDYINDKIQRFVENPIPLYSYNRQVIAMVNFNSCKRLKKIANPTLIMQGKKDIIVPPKNGDILSELIPEAKLVVFENSAHAIFPHEPELFFKILFDFLL